MVRLLFLVFGLVITVEPLIGLVDSHSAVLKVKVCRGQGQRLTLTDAAPIQHFKGIERNRLVHHFCGKLLVFLFRPEQHLPAFLVAHISGL